MELTEQAPESLAAAAGVLTPEMLSTPAERVRAWWSGTRLALLCTAAVLSSLPTISSAASFNCTKAISPNEIRICSDPQLSAMDDALGSLYVKAKAATRDAVGFKRETNIEWKKREACTDGACLVEWYQHRSAQLAAELANSDESGPNLQATPPPPTNDSTNSQDDSTSATTSVFWIIGAVIVVLWLGKRGAKGKDHLTRQNAQGGAFVANAIRRSSEQPATRDSAHKTRHGNSTQFEVRISTASPPPRPNCKPMPTVWVLPGRPISVHGISLPGGMLYVGNTLVAPDGGIEPAQIDPTLDVDSKPANAEERLFGYWPRYDSISPTARRAYLTWLAGGRRDPNADIGYVFLFFYGIERRLLLDARLESVTTAEIAVITTEIASLRSTYNNGSFLRYSSDLLDFLSADTLDPGLCLKPPPPATGNRGMSLRLRIGLGQAAVDARPVPAEWALAWVHSEPNISLPGSARRCVEKFDAAFMRGYKEKFGDGLRLSVNRTKLKVTYRPASGGLLHQNFTSSLADLPDITTVVTPVKKLQALVKETAEALDAYSRLIGRHPERATSLEATLLLPRALWDAPVQMAFDAIDKRIGTGMLVIKLSDLLKEFGGTTALTRDTLKQLFQFLHTQRVGAEPDVLAGARTPKAEDSVVLFRLAEDEGIDSTRQQANYSAVAVMLDLALTLANADGQISGREVQFLNRQVDAWSHVGAAAQRRLRARLRFGIIYPPTLPSLKARIEPLPGAARQGLAKLLSSLALADGQLKPEAVKHLEKVYQLLGIEKAALYRQLHVTSAAPESGKPAAPAQPQTASLPVAEPLTSADSTTTHRESRLRLDAARIAALQRESEHVTAILSKVFEEQEIEKPAPVVSEKSAEEGAPGHARTALLGLDPEHAAFLRALLARPSWSRAELSDMAADMELMLDGALERVNEATLDAFDSRIAEGDDPIEISRELMETLDT